MPGLFRSYIRRVEVSAPLEAVWKNLYMIAGSVHSFNLLTELAREFGHDDEPTIMDRYYRPLFEDLFNDADEYVERLAYGTMPFSFDTFLERLKDEVLD